MKTSGESGWISASYDFQKSDDGTMIITYEDEELSGRFKYPGQKNNRPQ